MLIHYLIFLMDTEETMQELTCITENKIVIEITEDNNH